MLTDRIADLLTRLHNATQARHRELVLPSSNLLKAIATVLMKKRFIVAMEEMETKNKRGSTMKELRIVLRTDREPLEVKRVSKPGQRIYVSHADIKRVRSGYGIGIFSTSKGVLSDEEARKAKTGGEYLCEIY